MSGIEAQQQAFNRLGVQLYRTLQPGDDRIVCDAAAVGDHAVVRLEVAGGTGREVAAARRMRAPTPIEAIAPQSPR